MTENGEIDYQQMTNKDLEEVIKEAEEAYKNAQAVVIEHCKIMDAVAEIYNNASELLNKRTGGRWKKQQEKLREENTDGAE